jgi:hypothetical protein
MSDWRERARRRFGRERTRTYFRRRWRALAAAVVLGAGLASLSPRPPERNLDALRTWLGERAHGTVAAADLVWEPQGSALAELVCGRGLWFLAAAEPGAPRDVYRAWVRLAPNGQPLSVRRVLALTHTPEADESGLSLAGERIAFATIARGSVAAVSVLEPAREPGVQPLERLLARETTGELQPLERTDLLLDVKASAAAVTLGEHSVRVELAELARSFEYELVRRRFVGDVTGIAHASSLAANEGAPRLTLVALLRSTLGMELTALAARPWFRAEDALLRAFAHVAPNASSEGAKGETPHFEPVTHALLKPPLGTDPAAGATESYLFEATLAPDRARPGARLELVALDLRQLELGLAAGSEWPRASLGPAGEGRLPEDAERYRRVVAVFNAGPEAAYTRYGAMADGRLLTPPSAHAPSLAITRSGRVLLGGWSHGEEIPPDIAAFTQRKSALVGAGVAIPSADDSVRRRTALCLAADGRLVYAYADAMDASTLGSALARAGCEYALPLATSPERLGFALADVRRADDARFELLVPRMDFDAAAILRGSTRDFFFVMVRDMTPKQPPGVTWHPDGGAQPPPAWLPGILAGDLPLGGITVKLASFAPGRLDWRLRPGPLEPTAGGRRWVDAIAEADRARAVAAIELGHATGATRFGLALGTQIPLPLRPSSATLVLGSGTTRILLPGEAVTLGAGEQAVQLPLLADDSDVTDRARERGDTRPRSALGVTEDGRVVVALLRHDSSDPLAVALRAAGCRRVVELDRGSHHPASLERAGTDKPPRDAPESTTLWALARK